MNRNTNASIHRLFALMGFVIVIQTLVLIAVVTRSHPSSNIDPSLLPSLRSYLDDESNIPIPRHVDGTHLTVEERLRYLELKTNAFMNSGADPFFGSTVKSTCKNDTNLEKYGCHKSWEGYFPPNCPGLFDHRVCLDKLPAPTLQSSKDNEPTLSPPQDCLVYDFGIRSQPQFGAVMARSFGCEVHAFDPSPISTKWWDSKEADKLRSLPNYHFHPYGAGGMDGELDLKEYDWGQVSIMRYPTYLIDCANVTEDATTCRHKQGAKVQKSFPLKVKTMETIRRELGHEHRKIDVLKIDVEGSEFAFLENMLDTHAGKCPNFINQLTLEWHHMPWDVRYGEGSSPSINAIVTLLHACGLKLFWQLSPGGWPSNQHMFEKMNMHDVRYNLASFQRE